MLGIDRQRQAINEAAAFGRSADEQGVHGRHQPDHAQVIGEGCGRRHRFAIDAAFAHNRRGALLERPLDPGAQRSKPQRALDLGGDRPRAVALAEGHLIERRAAQTAAGREERNGLDQIGLAGAVRPDQHDRLLAGFERGRVVVAEIVERQAAGSSVIGSRVRNQNPSDQHKANRWDSKFLITDY